MRWGVPVLGAAAGAVAGIRIKPAWKRRCALQWRLVAAREQHLIDVAAPLLRWGKVKISGKIDVDLSRSGPPTHAGRGPGDRDAELEQLCRRLRPLAIDKMLLDAPPPAASPLVLNRVHWVGPELAAEIKF